MGSEREREQERALTEKMRKKNGLCSERERERERALSDKNEKENGFTQRERERERERELYQVNERTRAQVVEEIIKKLRISITLIKEMLK